MRGKPSAGINVGGSSILVVFVLLCLTTFPADTAFKYRLRASLQLPQTQQEGGSAYARQAECRD